ncbi:rod shape-determining protein MreD [Pleurocapsa sp. PCC 7319]|uniref:rod shape-determining protein MreD n=1 Tax=Pleurocapsa sp. PCC 7319 TaxID=118161 RepID=UPI000475CD31|nr:rod shape-determining protein MreD [Pleurocapsa sp. PCC 7319]
MPTKIQTSNNILNIINTLFICASVVLCSLLMLLHIPGMELLQTNPNWLLIWVVSWSLQRSVWQAAIAGLSIGWIYDGMTISSPSHVLSLVLVGVFTSALQKQKYIGEDFISVALIVFFMTVLAETIFALQYTMQRFLSISEVWQQYQQIVITTAMITSLWSPAFYYPFNLWQQRINRMAKNVNS